MGEERILEGHLARAGILANTGALAAAEGEYRAALAVDPACAEARAGLAAVLLGSGRPVDAEPEFRHAVQAGVNRALSGLALCLRARGADAEARALLEDAVAAGTADPLCREVLDEIAVATTGLGLDIDATGLRFTYGEEFLAFRCRRCGRTWEQTFASAMCVLRVTCPGCDARARLEPEEAIALSARLEPALSPTQADAFDRHLATLVGTWHRDPALAALLAVGDVNVAECAEHEVMALVLDAALAPLGERAS